MESSNSVVTSGFVPRWLDVLLRVSTLCLASCLTVSGDLLFEAREDKLCSYMMDDDGNIGDASCFLENLSFTVGVDADVRDQILFFSDINEGTIRRVSIAEGPQQVEQIFHGLGSVEDMAVDWLSRNLYWTDFQLGHVCVSRYDGSRRAVLNTDQNGPRSIAVHPARGFLFWTNVGNTLTAGNIMRADLAGNNERVLVSSGLSSPNGLAIDFTSNRLYFADRGTEKIESVNLGGSKREQLYQADTADFFDMTILGGFLFTTRWSGDDPNSYITAVEYEYPLPDSSYFVPTVIEIDQHVGKALGITTFDDSRQSPAGADGNGVCMSDNGGCDHLCLPISNSALQCECATGYALDIDGVSCITDLVDRDFILFADSSLSTIFQGHVNDTDATAMWAVDLEGVGYPVDLAFDPVEAKVYWTDRSTMSVNRARLDGSEYEIVTARDINDPSGIDLDVLRRQVYWVDENRKTINTINMDLTGQKVVIESGLDQPRALAVNPLSGEIFWTDWGQTAKIEKAKMDGSGRETLVSSGVGWPNGITIDVQGGQLFWCDAQNDIIETSDLEGGNRRVLSYLADTAHPFGLAVNDEHIFWSDWTTRAVYSRNRNDGSETMLSESNDEFLRIQGMCSSTVSYPLDAVVSTIAPDMPTTPSEPVSGDGNPFTSDNVVTLIAAAVGGGLGFLAIIIIATLIVCKCNNKGSNTRSLDAHLATEGHAMANIPPPPYPGKDVSLAPESKLKPRESRRDRGDHIYEDLEGYRSGLDFDSDAYLNPVFVKNDGGGSEYTGLKTTANTPSYTSDRYKAHIQNDEQQAPAYYLDLNQPPQHPPQYGAGAGGAYMDLRADVVQQQQAPRPPTSPRPSKTSVPSMANQWPPQQSTHSAPRPPASPRPKISITSNYPPQQSPRISATRPPPSPRISQLQMQYQPTNTESIYLDSLGPAPKPPGLYESSMHM